MTEKEISFFKKIIMSIKDFEKYPELACKKWNVVLSYLLKLLAVFVLIVSFVFTYNLEKKIEKGIKYINDEIPNFEFINNKLQVENNEKILNTNLSDVINTLIIDASELNEQQIQEYREKLEKAQNGIILLEDKALIKIPMSNQIIEQKYTNIFSQYSINDFNKNDIIQYFSGTNMVLIVIGIFVIIYIYMFLIYFMSIWIDILLLTIFGYITSLILRLHIRFAAMCKIVIHSLTLPLILNVITIIVENFTTFRIQYFEAMYIGVAYIYIVASILMIKADIIKNQKELQKIIEEQEKVKQELKEKDKQDEKNKEDKQNESKDDKNKDKEEKEDKNNEVDSPQGENA